MFAAGFCSIYIETRSHSTTAVRFWFVIGIWSRDGRIFTGIMRQPTLSLRYHSGPSQEYIYRPVSVPYVARKSQVKKTSILKKQTTCLQQVVCDPCRIQTCNPHIRSVVLYSVELMDQSCIRTPPFFKSGCKSTAFF